ncbi:MAG: anaerobic ribonucleoside-triphosphate reductase activating protein [Candidatus Bipolaricaulota bacterium]
MHIAAWLPLSLCDDPGKLAAVVFLGGCNLRCPFCHNPELVLPELVAGGAKLDPTDLLARLADRRGFLDSVVVTGGEPTLQPDLGSFLLEVRRLGFSTKLDTNGTVPERLADLLARGLVDYVAMDLKGPPERYDEFCGTAVDLPRIEQSIDLVRSRAPDGEFRTTVAPGLAARDLVRVAQWIQGPRRYFLQPFRAPVEKSLVDPTWAGRDALGVAALRAAWPDIAPHVQGGGIRDA